MSQIRPDDLPPSGAVNPASAIIVDDGVTVSKATPVQVVDSGRPIASQAQAEAGVDNANAMTALRVKQAIDAQTTSLADLAAPSGASLIGFSHDETYQQGTIGIHGDAIFHVTDAPFNAVIDGTTDTTTATNLATDASATWSSSLRRSVHLANGTTVLGESNTPAFVRKGQTITGSGLGASWLDVSSRTANTAPIIKFGEKSDGTDDPGGDPVEAHSFSSLGGPSSFAIIDTNSCAGWSIHDVFFSSPGVGINATGGDGLINGCIFDDGLNGIVVAGGNIKIENNLFFLINQQITLNTGAYDVQIQNCQFEYMEVVGVLFNTGATALENIQIRNCNFLQNEQFSGSDAIKINSSGANAVIQNGTFRNLFGAAVAYGTGLGNRLVIDGCVFDGNKTLAAYAQSTTMQGVQATNMHVTIRNCTFRNLPGQPITLAGAEISTLVVENCRFESCTGGSTEISITNSNGSSSVRIINCFSTRGHNAIVNSQSTVPVVFTSSEFRGARAALGADILDPTYPYIVQWSAEPIDTDGLMDQGVNAGRFTIPAGKGITRVRLTANIIFTSGTTGTRLVQIRKNETGTTDTQTVVGQAANFAFGTQPLSASSGVIECSAGDWFDVRVYSSEATADIASGIYGSYFTIEVLG